MLATTEQKHNFFNLYADVFWWGILAGSTLGFLNIYATRLGATSFHIGLLTAGPAIVNLFVSLPAGRILQKRNSLRATFTTSLLHRIFYIIFIIMPWLLTASQQIQAIIWVSMLMSIPGTALAISFNTTLAETVSPDWRATVIGRRNALLSAAMVGSSLLCGQLLDALPMPTNYQIVFAIGALGAGMSSYHLARLRLSGVPAARRHASPTYDLARPGLMRFADSLRNPTLLRTLARAQGKKLIRPDLLRSRFGLFLLSYFFFYTVQNISVPLFPQFFVNNLKLTDSMISIGTALFHVMMMLTSMNLHRLSQREGHHQSLVIGAAAYAFYPLVLSIFPSTFSYLLASTVGGITWGITNGSLINRLMQRVPEDDRPAHMALHNMALNLGILLGALSGPLLESAFDIRSAIFVGGALRLLAALIFTRWG